jgi:hypothetical protein
LKDLIVTAGEVGAAREVNDAAEAAHLSGILETSSGKGTSPPNEPMRLGSGEHLTLFRRTMLDTFNSYRPAVIDWPELDDEALERLMSLPIWDIAIQTEGRVDSMSRPMPPAHPILC